MAARSQGLSLRWSCNRASFAHWKAVRIFDVQCACRFCAVTPPGIPKPKKGFRARSRCFGSGSKVALGGRFWGMVQSVGFSKSRKTVDKISPDTPGCLRNRALSQPATFNSFRSTSRSTASRSFRLILGAPGAGWFCATSQGSLASVGKNRGPTKMRSVAASPFSACGSMGLSWLRVAAGQFSACGLSEWSVMGCQ